MSNTCLPQLVWDVKRLDDLSLAAVGQLDARRLVDVHAGELDGVPAGLLGVLGDGAAVEVGDVVHDPGEGVRVVDALAHVIDGVAVLAVVGSQGGAVLVVVDAEADWKTGRESD